MASPAIECVALSLLPFSTRCDAARRLRAGTSPCDVLHELARASGERAGPKDLLVRAAEALDRASEQHQAAVVWSEARYPSALAAIADPPPVLWLRGQIGALDRIGVAIVGSRAGSPYACAVAKNLAADLAARGIAVVSGLARGVDSAAHRGALEAGGTTIAVLGSGADVVYPREHAMLAVQMEGAGAVVSELAPGTPPRKHFFPLRNRIISGLSRAVVVVEAGDRSGSLITARAALEQGRDVLAVPGNVLTGRNRGAHALLRDGARLVETAEDIVDELRLPRPDHVRFALLPEAPRDPVLDALTPGEPADLDAIAEKSGLMTAQLLPRLFELELQGVVARAGGGRFVRV
jgi:DNA processing protein